MTASTFTIQESARCSLRPGHLVLVADIGRIHGDQCHLIGVCRDWDSENGIVSYGIATSADVAKLEMSLGQKLNAALESGETIQSWTTADAPIRLVDIRKIEIVRRVPVSAATAPSSMLQKLTTNQTRHADFDAAVAEHGVQMIRIEKQREAALSLRKTWSIQDMTHRSDWPTWLPSWIRDLIREGSRHWLELPNQPAPEVQAVPPVIQSVIVEATPAPVAVEQGFVATLKGIFA